MEIRRGYEHLIQRAYQPEPAPQPPQRDAPPEARETAEGDRVEISERTEELRQKHSRVEEPPERQQRIEELADRVREGRYQLDSREIARSMLEQEE